MAKKFFIGEGGIRHQARIAQRLSDAVPKSLQEGAGENPLKGARLEEEYDIQFLGTHQVETMVNKHGGVVLKELVQGRRYRVLSEKTNGEKTGKHVVQMSTSTYGIWEDHAHFYDGKSSEEAKSLVEATGAVPVSVSKKNETFSPLTVNSEWVALEESLFQGGLSSFRHYVRESVRLSRKTPTEREINQQASKPQYQEMIDLVQTVLPRKPTKSEIHKAAGVVAEEMGVSKEKVDSVLESLNEGLPSSVTRQAPLMDQLEFMRDLVWHGLQSSWLAFQDALMVNPYALEKGFTHPEVTVAIALGLGVALIGTGHMALVNLNRFGTWVKQKWQFKELQPNRIKLPNDFPSSGIGFLVKGEFYRIRVEAPIIKASDPQERGTLKPLAPFKFIGFGKPRWIKGQFIRVEPRTGSWDGIDSVIPAEYLSQIETLEGNLVKEMV